MCFVAGGYSYFTAACCLLGASGYVVFHIFLWCALQWFEACVVVCLCFLIVFCLFACLFIVGFLS